MRWFYKTMRGYVKTRNIFSFLLSAVLVVSSNCIGQGVGQGMDETITIDAKATTTPFPHFWETIFGSGRAILSLRESYRNDLRATKKITDIQAVRFHGIFMDEVGLYDPDRRPIQFAQMTKANVEGAKDTGIYNFSYIDQICDGLLDNGVRPFVELSFMPKKMASDANALHAFWYKQNVSPPKDYAAWDAMIGAFAQHLVDRYGIEEVSHWYFEVWNEPNIDFWMGNPKQPTYFELYDHTAAAIKKVSPRLRVGGPSTAQAAWVGDFLRHCQEKNIPVDFVSTHVYANDTAKDVFHTDENIPRDRMVARSVQKVHGEIASSPYPKMPLIFSEYNASYANEPDVTDTVYMGPWLATTISQCDGLTEAMSYWTFSDVFEEQGVVRTPFYGGFGILAEHGIPKPAFNAFAMLHQLGEQRIKVDSESALATKRSDGALVVALWNYAAPYGTGAGYTPPPAASGPERSYTLKLENVPAQAEVQVERLDADHGNVLKTYDSMGRPTILTREQILQLRAAGRAAAPENGRLNNGSVTLRIPAQGLVLVTVAHAAEVH
jgi:xylan 1,4-beta-xylosidase